MNKQNEIKELKKYVLVKDKKDIYHNDGYYVIIDVSVLKDYWNGSIDNGHLIATHANGETFDWGDIVATGDYLCDVFQVGFSLTFEEEDNIIHTLLVDQKYLDKIKAYTQDWQRSYMDECINCIDFTNNDNTVYCIWVKKGLYE